jgi:hypothetical protein
MKRNLSICRLALLPALLAAGAAQAYVPPSGFQIVQMAKRHKGLKSLRVKTRITGPSTQIREIGYFDFGTRTFKARFLDQNDQEIYAFERKLGSNDSLSSLLLFETNPNHIAASLKNAGVPVLVESELLKLPDEPARIAAEKTGIARLDRRIGWTIGDADPSLWVLKDEFVPLRLATGGVEIRFEETKNVHDFPYARAISIWKGSDAILKGEAMELSANPDPADMKAIHVQGLPAIPSSLASDQRALIEQWVQWIR